jgi:hypothetical protein
MENLIVGVIICAAVYFFLRELYRNFKPKEGNACGCGCSGCAQPSTCGQLIENEKES